jgi:hypothetical protein
MIAHLARVKGIETPTKEEKRLPVSFMKEAIKVFALDIPLWYIR